ncbi:T9SS type A sorting domain-containing protein [Flavobacterium anhuiense]|uniref:T9SS type A sorting domain-containing protein n=1 Tax=Flavobacterium anhuiense TaxID=459526 RepID=UPI003D962459
MKKTLLFLLFFFTTFTISSQNPSDVEHAFGSIPGFNGDISDIKKQPDGKIIVAGSFEKFQGKIQRRIIRLNTDGSKDNSFDIGSGFLSTNTAYVRSISLQNDGKILAGGNFSSYNGISQSNLVRLNTDGSIDNTFKIGNALNSYGSTVLSIRIQKDGKILVGGNFTKFSGITQNYLIRLNQDGSIDNSFDIGTGFNNSVRAISIQEDGKILVVGSFTSYKGINSNRIIRLNSDGNKDLTFDIGTGFQGFHGYGDTSLSSIVQQSDGKILVGGDFTFFNGSRMNSLVRLNIDGSKDNSFDIGSGFNGSILSIAIDEDKKIIAGGSFSTFQNNIQSYLIRLNSDGSKDNSLDLKTGFSNSIFSINIQTDGKIILGGAFFSYQETYQSRLLRVDSNGDKDDSFNLGLGFNDGVHFISMQKDGKLILSGYFNTYQSTKNKYFVRLKADGNLDKSFKTGNGFNKYVWVTAVQSDQKILVGGAFNSYDGVPEPYLIRLNSDGSKDQTFNLGSGFNSAITSILIQKDGKILVKGPFTSFQGNTQKYLIRLNQDGSRDTSFNINNELVNNEISYVFLQNDGKILITSSIGTDKFILIRLNNDGSQDTTFNMTAQSRISSIAQQTDGKILIGSHFNFYNGDPKQYLIRLNSDGTKDLSFNNSNEFFSPDNLFRTEVTNIVIQNDGKIIAGGFFPNASGLRSAVVRLNSDGSADNTFNLKTFHSDRINSIILEPNGKIIIGGGFELYDGSNGYNNSAFLIRLFGNYVATPVVSAISKTDISCNSSTGSASIEVYGGRSPYTYLWSNGEKTSEIAGLIAGDYSCTVTDADLTAVTKNFKINLITDLESPTIVAPKDISLNISSGCNATGVVLGNPITSDNCTVASVTNNAPSAFPVGETTVIWTVTDANNNTATATQIVKVKGIDVTITNNSGILTAVETGASYKWLECNNGTFTAITNETKASFTPTKTGSYAVEITKNNCSVTSDCYVVQTLGTADFELENSLKLYPNPSKDFITIKINTLENTKLKVFDVNGRFVFSKELKKDSTTVDISNLSVGVYMFEISNETGKSIKKVIKK